jgi:hypothetical protein
VRRLVQGVQSQPLPAVRDGLLPLRERAVAVAEPLQRAGQLAAQFFGLEELPVIEGSAVAQGEPRQKIVAVQRHRLGERG